MLKANEINNSPYYLILTGCFTIAFGMLLFIWWWAGYWDGCFIIGYQINNPVGLMEYFSQMGAPHTGYLHYVVFTLLGPGNYPYQILTFLTTMATMFVFYRCITLLSLLHPIEALLLTLLFVFNPVYFSYISSIMFPLSVWMFLFVISFLFTIEAVQKTNRRDKIVFSILSFITSFCSYTFNSLILMEFIRPIIFYFVLFGSMKDRRKKIKKITVYWWPNVLGVIVFSYLRFFVFAPYGIGGKYISIDIISTSVLIKNLSYTIYVVFWDLVRAMRTFAQLPLLIIILSVCLAFWLSRLLEKKIKDQTGATPYKISGFVIFSLVSLLIGISVFILAGKTPSFGLEDRYASLSSLGIAFFVFFSLKFIIENKTAVFYLLALILLLKFGYSHIAGIIPTSVSIPVTIVTGCILLLYTKNDITALYSLVTLFCLLLYDHLIFGYLKRAVSASASLLIPVILGGCILVFLKKKRALFYFLIIQLIFVFGYNHIESLIRFDIDSFKIRAIINHISEHHSKNSLEDTLLIFYDQAQIYNAHGRYYRRYDYEVPVNYHLHTKNILAVDAISTKNMFGIKHDADLIPLVKQWFEERKGLLAYLPATKFPAARMKITIKANDSYTVIDQDNRILFAEYFRLKLLQISGSGNFNPAVDKLVQLEFSPT